jgi:hypothetical protein
MEQVEVKIEVMKTKKNFEVIEIMDDSYLNEGSIYNEYVNEEAQSSIIGNIYNIIGNMEDCINHTFNGELRWRSVLSYDTNPYSL